MALNDDLRKCRIVVRDPGNGETIADTIVLTHNQETGEVEIEADGFPMAEGATFSALLFSKAGLFETLGTVGKKNEGQIVLALYEGSDKDDRQAVRYQVSITGTVDLITRGEEKLHNEFEITVQNMSSIGLLIQAPESCIQEGDVIHFIALTKGQRIAITAQANRVEHVGYGKEKIGCVVQLVNLA